MIKFIILGMIAVNAYAYIPSVQSLLRNSPNKDLEENSILANIKITKLDKKNIEELIEDTSIENIFSYRFYNQNGRFTKFTQKNYIGNSVNSQALSSIHYIKNLNLNAIGASNIDKDFYYSILGIFLLNDEAMFVDFLKKRGITIPSNSQIRNSAQISILNEYIKKLESEEENVSLVPQDLSEEEKSQRLQVLGESFLRPDGVLKRVKENNNLKYKYTTENLNLEFSAQSHEILFIEVKTSGETLKLTARDYEELSNGFRFPKFLKIDLGEKYSYKISLEKLILYDDNGSKFTRALEKGVKELEASTSNKNLTLNRLTI